MWVQHVYLVTVLGKFRLVQSLVVKHVDPHSNCVPSRR